LYYLATVTPPIVAAVREFVEREVRPLAPALEHADTYPHEMVARMKALGLFGALVPKDFGGLGIDVKGVDNLVCDLPSRPLTVALVPDEAGGLVELVNQIRLTVQHHRLAVDETGTDVRSSLRVFGHPNH